MTTHTAQNPPLLRLSEISFRHPRSDWLFRDLTLAVSRGEVVALVGASGCGKSTLLRIAAGLVEPGGGRRDCTAHTITQVFQTPRLLPWRSAFDNVRLPLQLGADSRRDGNDAAARQRCEELLSSVGLGGAGELAPGQLSLGMQMRVALARALAPMPDFVLLDEPFAAVDEPTRMRLNRLVVDVVDRQGCAGLYVTHSAREAVGVADRVVVLGRPARGIIAEFAAFRGGDHDQSDTADLERRIVAEIEHSIGEDS